MLQYNTTTTTIQTNSLNTELLYYLIVIIIIRNYESELIDLLFMLIRYSISNSIIR